MALLHPSREELGTEVVCKHGPMGCEVAIAYSKLLWCVFSLGGAEIFSSNVLSISYLTLEAL